MKEIWIRSVISFVGLFIVHAVVLRFRGKRFYVSRALSLYSAFAGVSVVYESWHPLRDRESAWIFVITLGLLWAFQMVVVVNLLNSVSLRMVRTLIVAPGGQMDQGKFAELFSESPLLATRIQLLEDNQFIVQCAGQNGQKRVELTPKGRRLAAVFSGIQRIFRITHIG